MPKYIMRNGLKIQSFCGSKIIKTLDNGVKIGGVRDFVFEPNKVVDTGDFDLSSWVKLKYLIEIKEEEKKNIIDEDNEKEENILVVSSKNIGSENLEDKIDNEVDINNKECEVENEVENEIEDEEDDTDDKIEKDNDSNEDDIKYEKIEDGFRCIICGKILKSEKRMSTHIRKKHSKLESN